MELVGVGLYSLAEAQRLTGAQPREIRRWLRGYTFKTKGEPHFSAPLWAPQVEYPEAIGFRDLLELRFVKYFVSIGCHLTLVRAAFNRARTEFDTAYPFTAHKFLSDGKRIFHEALEAAKAAPASPLTDVLTRQVVIDPVIRPSLYAGIEYRHDRKSARRWYPVPNTRAIVLDPEIAFGKAILARYGIPTDTIAAAAKAEKSVARAARIFDVPREAVALAVRYERRLAA